MKIKVTLMTENDKPVSDLGDNPKLKARKAWDLVCVLLNAQSEDKISVEDIEIIGD